MQETALARAISSALGIGVGADARSRSHGRASVLHDWAEMPEERWEKKTGCLGDVVQSVLSDISSEQGNKKLFVCHSKISDRFVQIARLRLGLSTPS
jgi:hypothetical protein